MQDAWPGYASPRPKILLAEDHREMRMLVAQSLRAEGYDVVEVCNGVDLAAEVRRAELDDDNPRNADLLVIDVRMPGGSGLDCLGALRQTDWLTPAIVITAFPDARTFDEAMRLGATAVLCKPFELAALTSLVKTLVAPFDDDA